MLLVDRLLGCPYSVQTAQLARDYPRPLTACTARRVAVQFGQPGALTVCWAKPPDSFTMEISRTRYSHRPALKTSHPGLPAGHSCTGRCQVLLLLCQFQFAGSYQGHFRRPLIHVPVCATPEQCSTGGGS